MVLAARPSNGSFVQRTLGRLTVRAIRRLSRIARRLGYPALATVPVSAAMLSRLQTVSPQQHLEDVAALFVGGRNAEIPVVVDGTPVAVVTRDDVARGLAQNGPHASIAEAPRHDVVTVTPSDSLADVLEQLRAYPDAVAVVLDHGSPVGLLTYERLSAYIAAQDLA